MKKFDNDKVTSYRCIRCHKHIWVPESIIRGMGPICYGKSYTIKTMLKRGMTKEEIENIPKEEMERLTREAVRRYKRKQQRTQKQRIPKNKIRNFKKDNKQTTLLPFLYHIQTREEWLKKEKETHHRTIRECEIDKLKEELNTITQKLSTTSGSQQMTLSDRSFEIMKKLKNLEEME